MCVACGYAAARLSAHDADSVLLYQGMYNAGNEAHIVATSDWPIATVAQEPGVCQSQVRRGNVSLSKGGVRGEKTGEKRKLKNGLVVK